VHTAARDEVEFLCGPHRDAAISQNPRLIWMPARFRKHCDVCDIKHAG
jgi:hypothetical protein